MKKRKSPREVIEGLDPSTEHGFVKSPLEGLKDVSLLKSPESVMLNPLKVISHWIRHDKKPYVDLHTHPYSDVGRRGIALPSAADLDAFHSRSSSKASVIAQQYARTGELEGYTVLRRTKGTVFPPNTRELITEDYAHISCGESVEWLRDFAEECNFQVRFVPATGYKFNEKGGRFIQKSMEDRVRKYKGLEPLEKVVAVFLGIMGLGLIGASSVTGNVIGASSIVNSGAIVLGGVACIGGFWLFLKKR